MGNIHCEPIPVSNNVGNYDVKCHNVDCSIYCLNGFENKTTWNQCPTDAADCGGLTTLDGLDWTDVTDYTARKYTFPVSIHTVYIGHSLTLCHYSVQLLPSLYWFPSLFF